MELIFLFADDLLSALLKILRESNSPIVIITIVILSLIIFLITKFDSRSSFETQTKIFKNSISCEKFVEDNKKLLGDGRTKEVINNLLIFDHPVEKERITNEVLIISSRYNQETSNRRKGTGEDNIELNRINNSLLEILDSLKA